MIREAIATGATIEAARDAAILNLNPPKNADLQIEVIELPVKKTFGLFGGSPAKVKVSYQESPANMALEYLTSVLETMKVPGLVMKSEENADGLDVTVECDDYGLIIGHRGDTLDSLQYLAGLVANRAGTEYYRVTINAANYREKRESTLVSLAKKNAIQVSRTGRSITLEPMNPYERRIVHTAVQQIKGAKSHSVGEDVNRCVVITPDENFKPERGFNKPGQKNFGGSDRGRPPYKPGGSGKPPYNKSPGYKGSNTSGPRSNYAPAGRDKPFSDASASKPFSDAGGSKPFRESGGQRPYRDGGNSRPYRDSRPPRDSAPQAPRPESDSSAPKKQVKDAADAKLYGIINKNNQS